MRFLKNLLVLCLILSLSASFIACSGDEEESVSLQDERATESSVAEGSTDESEDESATSYNDTSDDESQAGDSSEAESEDEESADVSEGEGYTNDTSKSDNTVSDKEESSAEEESSESESEDEMIGTGTKDDPYMEFPDTTSMTLNTVSIAGAKSVHYGIYRVGGMILTINDKDAYVVYEGTRYNASNGVVSLKIASALASDAVYFEIGNSGSAAKSFTISFANPTGSFMNPTVFTTVGDDVSLSLDAGADTGYYYKYIAEKNGTMRFYKSSDAESIMLITNNRNSAQRSFDELEDGAEYIELDVKKGDEIIINVGAKPNKRGKYPAVSIVWRAEYI